jgi:hypothetical protein
VLPTPSILTPAIIITDLIEERVAFPSEVVEDQDHVDLEPVTTVAVEAVASVVEVPLEPGPGAIAPRRISMTSQT